jgi:hypothetical protein
MGLRRPERVSRCAFTAVIANWVCALFAMIEMEVVTNLCIGATIVATGAVPELGRRWQVFRERRRAEQPAAAGQCQLVQQPDLR